VIDVDDFSFLLFFLFSHKYDDCSEQISSRMSPLSICNPAVDEKEDRGESLGISNILIEEESPLRAIAVKEKEESTAAPPLEHHSIASDFSAGGWKAVEQSRFIFLMSIPSSSRSLPRRVRTRQNDEKMPMT